jgi:orotate phosphoribosyltransferase
VSDYYLDLRLTTTHPEGVVLAARFLLAEALRLGANRIGGPTLGADPLVGASMALAPAGTDLGGFIVRGQAKDHGTGRQIEGHLGPGDRALVFDDVVTAGGSIVKAIDAVRAAGAEVVGTWCLVDRGQGGREKLAEIGAPLHPLFEVAEVLAEDRPEAEVPPSPWSPRTPFLAADAILELEPGQVLLIRRGNPPHGWALPGGFVEPGESVEAAVRREIAEETGLILDEIVQMHTYSEPGRDPRFATVSVIFVGRATGTPRAGDDAADARLFPIEALPEDLCFDHRRILDEFRTRRYGPGLGWTPAG